MRRGGNRVAQGGGSGWLTTFNDLMTLLMVFFVLLFTMGSLDIQELKQFQVSLMKGLGVLKKGEGSPIGVIEAFSTKGMKKKSIRGQMMMAGLESIADYINDLESLKGIDVRFREKDLVISLDGSALFKSGMAEIDPEAFPVLKKMFKIISMASCPVRVEGHTDNVPIFTEEFESNWELSTTRAVNVVKHFIEEGNVAPQQLSAVGYGESKPLVPNDTPEHRARNRRVEIVLEKSEEG